MFALPTAAHVDACLFQSGALFEFNSAHFALSVHHVVNSLPSLPTGYREGFLWKRGRDNGQYLSRKFILSEREGVLKYFNKHDVKTKSPSLFITHVFALHLLFHPFVIPSNCFPSRPESPKP